jgi:dCMP deaminase
METIVMRPSFKDIYMRLALDMSRRSTCRRVGSDGTVLRVGCAIVTPDFRKVIAVGYNGNASGLPNKCDAPDTPGACGCIHAEANAVVNCDSPRATEKIVFTSYLPCVNCAKLLINLGNVREVYYFNDYRIHTALELFDTVGIKHEQFISSDKAGEAT